MENGYTFLVAFAAVLAIILVPKNVEGKFSFSAFKSDLFSGTHRHSYHPRSRILGEYDPCAKYGDGHGLPSGHPCAIRDESTLTSVGLIPRLVGMMKQTGNRPPGVGRRPPGVGRRPPGVGRRPPGVGRHPPGVGRHPPGVGRHPPGVGKHPPGFGKRKSCRRNLSVCADPALYPVLVDRPDIVLTCCRKICFDLTGQVITSVRVKKIVCGNCETRCRASNGGPTCCSGVCSDVLSNPENCGACGNVCAATDVCIDGQCVPYNS